MSGTRKVLDEVASECERQDDKWGAQNHPMLATVLLNRPGGCSGGRMSKYYGIPSETRARWSLERARRDGRLSYFHILLGEICEVVACLDNTRAMREELVQVAAVAVVMIECIDRQSKTGAT